MFTSRFQRSSLAVLALLGSTLSASFAAAPTATTEKLPSGVTLSSSLDRTAPRVAISLLVRAGSSDETAESAGWRRLLTDAMLRAVTAPGAGAAADAAGTVLTPPELQNRAEELGGQVGASVADDTIEFWAVGDSTNQAQLLQLLLSVVRSPRLSNDDIDAARKNLLARVDDDSDVATNATQALRSQLYRDARGELSAYGLPPMGTFESLNSLTNDKIREFHQKFFSPAAWIVAATGDVNPPVLKAELAKVTAGANDSTPSLRVPFFAPPNSSQPALIVHEMNTPTAWVFISYAAVAIPQEDLAPLRVLSAILGESPKARLAKRLLDARIATNGLAPSAQQVAVQWTVRRFALELVAFAQTDPQTVEGVKNAILDEVGKLRDKPVPQAELNGAKNFVRGSWALDHENLRERAYRIAAAPALQTLPDADWPARINKVTPADIQRVAKKYLNSYAVALIMPKE